MACAEEVSGVSKAKKAKKAKLEAAEPNSHDLSSAGEPGAELPGSGIVLAPALSGSATGKAKSKKRKSKSKQAAELSAQPAGSQEPAKVQKFAGSKTSQPDDPAPLSFPEQQLSEKKKKNAKQHDIIEPGEDQPESLANPARKQKKGSAATNSANASPPSVAVAKEEKAAQAAEAAALELEAVKQEKKKKKAAKGLPADAAEQQTFASAKQLVAAAPVSKPETAAADAPVSRKSKKRKAKQGEAAAEIAQIDTEVLAKLAETVPSSNTPAESAKKSKKKRKKSEASVETGDGIVEEGTQKKKKKRKLVPSDSLKSAPLNATVSTFRAKTFVKCACSSVA